MAARKSKRIPALATALLLGAACKCAPVEAPADTPELAAPQPSSSLVMSPLDTAATGYTNEMQAANLSRETFELGIQQISKHLEEGGAGVVEKKDRMAQLKEIRLELTRARRGIDGARDKSVALPGSIPKGLK